ncbi:MAG TPA: hypothetical protein DD414_10060 [Lachnospiraceae bacterium]|nr:hypothetical protein [Lachnospiraceae bacterium]
MQVENTFVCKAILGQSGLIVIAKNEATFKDISLLDMHWRSGKYVLNIYQQEFFAIVELF